MRCKLIAKPKLEIILESRKYISENANLKINYLNQYMKNISYDIYSKIKKY